MYKKRKEIDEIEFREQKFYSLGETLKSAEALKTHHDTTEKRLRDKRSVFDQVSVFPM